MAKKLPSKKKVTPKNHEEAHVYMIHEKRESDGSKTVLKEKGAVQENENNPINTIQEGKSIVGLYKGLTVNLGNYESARINCWISRVSNDEETAIMDNLVQISDMLDEQIQYEVDELTDGKE